MKKLLCTIVLVLWTITTIAQVDFTDFRRIYQTMPTDTCAVYKLFPTSNMYNFIKLNTRNGQMKLVQWSNSSSARFEYTLSLISRCTSAEEQNGRFTLYPTSNIYNFILLDQISGECWQVQWGHDVEEIMVLPIM